MRPQPFVVETRDFTEGVVSAAMGVAGEIVKGISQSITKRRLSGIFSMIRGNINKAL